MCIPQKLLKFEIYLSVSRPQVLVSNKLNTYQTIIKIYGE